MQYPVGNETGTNVNMHRDHEHEGVMDYVVANKRAGFGPSFDYIDPNTPRDERYSLFKRDTYWNYQDDAFALAHFPGKCYGAHD